MKKRIISLFLVLAVSLSMFCPLAFADDSSTHEHDWSSGIISEFSDTVEGIPVSVSIKKCTKCNFYKHTYKFFGLSFDFYNVTAYTGIVEDFLLDVTLHISSVLGKNATAKQYQTGGGSAGTGGVGRNPSGYDSNNSALVSKGGSKRVRATFKFFKNSTSLTTVNEYFSDGTSNYVLGVPGKLTLCVGASASTNYAFSFSGGYFPVEYEPGYYTLPIGTQILNFNYQQGSTSYPNRPSANFSPIFVKTTGVRAFCYDPSVSGRNFIYYFYANSYNFKSSFVPSLGYVGSSTQDYTFSQIPAGTYNQISAPPDIYLDYTPLDASSTVTSRNNITINNNTWNGNIYQDNSTNLTYIYPQYTTINENNETVTNISNNPIIYNNTTNQYYTYDTVTNNYYYITYEAPTPSPSPDPDPTPTPAPGGDTGDTNSLLDVLVQIRDNMIQGFADIKATLVQGWADLSANFTLAIENLNVNIQNFFNKKFPSETPNPSPSPSPSPEPVDPILPDTQNYIIPKMNSNTFTDEHGTWIASGSSKYSDVFDFFHAFDRSTSDFWETNASPSYLQIEIPDPENYYIDGYIMRISKFDNRYPKGWTLQGSDDGETWDDLDTQAGQNLSDKAEHKYTLTLRKAYKYYRVNMSNYASSMCSLSHFNLLGYDAEDVVTPTPSPDTPDATPTPAPTDKPDSGNTTNNFWTIIFPNAGDESDGSHKGIFWALVSLILALVAFFTNMAAGYKYLFPFLPDGVVMTIHVCLFVLFLFVIIKFIMRSK